LGIAGGAMIAVLMWLIVGALCVSVWMGFTIRGLIRMTRGQGGPWASAMAQISVVAMLLGILRFGGLWSIGAFLFPPALLLILLDAIDLAITPRIAVVALPVAALTLAITVVFRPLRPFAIAITCACLVVSTLVAGDVISSRAMCATAEAQGLTDVTRNSFVWSISNTGREYQFDVHAMAQRGDDRVAWSYSAMDWYTFPHTISVSVQSGEPACALS
jgi:hypothetical protein